MNILFICNKSPYPAKEGGPIAMNMFIEGLINAGHSVKVLAVNSEKYAVKANEIPKDYQEKTQIETVFIDLRIKVFAALKCFLLNKSYHIQRFISPDFSARLKEILLKNQYDIVQFESLFVAPYIELVKEYSKAKIILRTHNVEHKIWEDIAATTKNPFKKFYLRHLSKTLKKYELSTFSTFDGLVCITQNDKVFFESQHTGLPCIDVSFGIDISSFEKTDVTTEFPSLFHLGAMNWIPNIQGIHWFIKEVWPDIQRQYPTLKLYLAGSAMPDELKKLNSPNIIVDGYIDDPIDYMASKAIMIVPLFSSSGVRIKIIEGMAAQKTIISTSKGAQGIDCKHNENILIANSKTAFIESIKKCIEDEAFCQQIGKSAKDFIQQNHNSNHLIGKLLSFYNMLLSSSNISYL